jgi:L-proline amide hydrolase
MRRRKNTMDDTLHRRFVRSTSANNSSLLAWYVLLLAQLLMLSVVTTTAGGENADDASAEGFRGWTCDELTPDLCDLTMTKGRIPIRDDGIWIRYWKYSSPSPSGGETRSSIDDDVNALLPPPPLPVIMVHGGPGMTHNYMLPLKQLACRPDRYGRTRDVYFYDQGGCGESVTPVNNDGRENENNDITNMTRLVEEHPYLLDPQYYATIELPRIIEHLGLLDNDDDETVSGSGSGYHIVANSWGTILAQYFVLNTNAKSNGLKSLTLSGPLSDGDLYVKSQWSETETNNLGQLPPFVKKRIEVLEQQNAYDSAEYAAIDAALTGRFTCRIQPAPDCVMAMEDGTNYDVYVGLQGPSEFTFGGVLGGFDTTPLLHTINVPVSLTSGAYDTMRPPVVDAMYREIPLAEWTVLDHSGHMTMIDDAGWMNDIVDDFLVRVEEASNNALPAPDEGASSSFRPLNHLCGPKGCLPKLHGQEKIEAKGTAEIDDIADTGYSVWVAIWVGIVSFVAGHFASKYQTIICNNGRSAGYESV